MQGNPTGLIAALMPVPFKNERQKVPQVMDEVDDASFVQSGGLGPRAQLGKQIVQWPVVGCKQHCFSPTRGKKVFASIGGVSRIGSQMPHA